MNTSRNTWENWENDNYKKGTFRTKASLEKMTLQWTAHLHQETAQFPNRQDPAVKDRWKWDQTHGDECEEKLEPSVPLARQETAGDHDDMDESMSLKHQFHQLLNTKLRY